MAEGINIDIEGVESQISGKTLEVFKKPFEEEWKTVDAINSAYDSLTKISEDFNGTIEDFASFIAQLRDNESTSYYPNSLQNRNISNTIDREEAIGYYMLSNPDVGRQEAEAAIDNENKLTSYDNLARKYGSSLDAEAMEEMNSRVAESREGLDREVAVNARIRLTDEDRSAAGFGVDNKYSAGQSYGSQTEQYKADLILANARNGAVAEYRKAHPDATQEDAEAAVDQAVLDGKTYSAQTAEYKEEVHQVNDRAAAELAYQALNNCSAEDAAGRIEYYHSNNNEYYDQVVGTFYPQLLQSDPKQAAVVAYTMYYGPSENAAEIIENYYNDDPVNNSYENQADLFIKMRNGLFD